MADADCPADVYPESGCRLPLPEREGLDEAARAVFDQHVDPEGSSIAGLRGPGGIKLHSPGLSAPMSKVTHYFRAECELSPRLREVIILVAAREMASQFEWAAHEPLALELGVSAAVVDAVKHDRATDGLPDVDALVIELGRQLFRTRHVTPDTFARAREAFGTRGLVDLVSLMGNYAAAALLLAAFDMQLPEGQEPLLPIE
jgi:4-carboxymuconolactone decarboxylase